MKIYQLSYADIGGGAFRSAYRLHKSLRASSIDSYMLVEQAKAGDWTVLHPNSRISYLNSILRSYLGKLPSLLGGASGVRSFAFLPSKYPKLINLSEADLINMHWIGAEMISIKDIALIKKPIVWTMHDMWAFSGSDHYPKDFRWKSGYKSVGTLSFDTHFDLDKWVWNRKIKYWKKPFQIVTPSNWLADCVRQSKLFRDWPVRVIPYSIDLNVWRPIDKALARNLLGLPLDIPLIMFGAIGGVNDERKGFDLLVGALNELIDQNHKFEVIIAGQMEPRDINPYRFKSHYMGYLHDDISLNLLYCAADLFILPSRQDNLPNTGIEAQACGTPVVGFEVGGIPDIIAHKESGYLSRDITATGLAEGIAWALFNEDRLKKLSVNSRLNAINQWSDQIISKKYMGLYQEVLKREA